MKKITQIIVTVIVVSLLTSCSCYYGKVTDKNEMPKELPIGTKVKTTSVLFGSLEEFIDNPEIHYVYMSRLKHAKKRYVLEQYTIPIGTVFVVRGFRKARNPICFNQELSVVLSPEKPFSSSSNAEVQIGLDEVLDALLFEIKSANQSAQRDSQGRRTFDKPREMNNQKF
jgi:hypothetical protein